MVKQALNKNNFGYLGEDFQYQLTKIFIEEPHFFEDTAPIVNQNAFTEVHLRTIVGIIKDYYMENGVVPTYELLRMLLKSKANTQVEAEEADAIINKLMHETSYNGCDWIKDKSIAFFKQQNMVKIAHKILEIAGSGDLDRYPECQKLIDDMSTIGQEEDFGYNIYDMMEKALSNDYTVSIPTGVKQLDDVLGGGLDKGKIGLIIAAAGFGKTTFTTAIASYAATYRCDMNNHNGFKVLQIYFEDDDVDITRKHYSRIIQKEAREFKRLEPMQKEVISDWLLNFKDKDLIKQNLRLKHFKTNTKSASDIEVYLKRLRNSGFVPDLVTIDYFECLAPEKGGFANDSEWTREGITMRKLENIAHDYDCAIWIPTQGSKDSMNSPEVVRMDQASGSAKKVHVAQLILSIARAIDDISKNRAVISILKNRSGQSGKIFNNVIFDNGTSTIKCSDIEVIDSELEWEEKASKAKEEANIRLTREVAKRVEEQRKNNGTPQSTDDNLVGQLS